MTFTEAAAEVLRLVGRPLHYKEITDIAIEKNLLSHVGKSPEVTMGARLAATLKKDSSENPLVRVKPGVFALREWDEKTIKGGLEPKKGGRKGGRGTEPPQGRARAAIARRRGARRGSRAARPGRGDARRGRRGRGRDVRRGRGRRSADPRRRRRARRDARGRAGRGAQAAPPAPAGPEHQRRGHA